MKKILTLIVSSMLIGLLGCATTQEASKASSQDETKTTADNRPCIKNLTIEGGFWQGQKYSTYQEFEQVNKGDAFDKMIPVIAAEGYQVVNASKEMGLISASGGGGSVPLNVILKQNKADLLRVEITVSLPPGTIALPMEVENIFCKIMDSVPVSNEKKIVEPTTPKQINIVEKKIEAAQAPSEKLPSASQVSRSLVVIKTANIRSEANDKSKIIKVLKKGTKVEYLGKSGDWFNIKLSPGVTGWVFNSLVTERE